MTKGLVLLFAVSFIIFTGLDALTTWVAIHWHGFKEINIFTDTSSMSAILLPEIVILSIGIVAVLVGALWKRNDMRVSIDRGFRPLYQSFWISRRLLASALIYLPISLALVRVLPVLSNSCYLLIGWSPIRVLHPLSEMLGWSLFRTVLLLHGIIGGALVVPITYVIYRVCRYGQQAAAVGPLTRPTGL